MSVSRVGPPIGAGSAAIVFDVGGTDTKSALLDQTGRFRGIRRTPTPRDERAPADVLAASLRGLAEQLRADHPDVAVQCAGVAVPGIVDEDTGTGVFSGNLGWRDAPLRTVMSAALGLPVALVHDVRGAGTAEVRLGAARDARNALVVVLGTGVAATVVCDGRIVAAGGYAGEIGHMMTEPGGRPCRCGATGCLETVASAAAIAARYADASGRAVGGAREVAARVVRGDAAAQRVWADAVEALAVQFVRLTSALAPEVIVVGGGLSRAGELLLAPLRARVEELCSFQRVPRIVGALLGEDAGLIGAALAARDQCCAVDHQERA